MDSRIGSQSETPMPPTAPCRAKRRETRSFFRSSMLLIVSGEWNGGRRTEGVASDEVGDQIAKHVVARAEARHHSVHLSLVVEVVGATVHVAVEVAQQALGDLSAIS